MDLSTDPRLQSFNFTILLANSLHNKLVIFFFFFFFFFFRKQDLTFHANCLKRRKSAWKVRPVFWKKNPICRLLKFFFTQIIINYLLPHKDPLKSFLHHSVRNDLNIHFTIDEFIGKENLMFHTFVKLAFKRDSISLKIKISEWNETTWEHSLWE